MELNGPPYLVDGHVHLHSCFDEARFFGAASQNFAAAARAMRLSESTRGILMLTESAGTNRFSDLRERVGANGSASLEIEPTGEPISRLVSAQGGDPVLVVAGRQVVTAEDLEVLALGCAAEIPDGQKLTETVEQVRGAEAIPVIPWGFGKWHSRRLEVLLGLLRQQPAGSFFLGDNGGRAGLMPQSSLFQIAAESGVRDLPGSDPLPFSREERRAGSFGFVFEKPLSPDEPATDLLRRLRESDEPLQTYGSGLGAPAFLFNQIGMQIRKRLLRKGS